MDGSAFRLDEASAAERVARDRLTHQAWGARLTREQYLERERLLRQTEHGQLHMHSWVLRVQSHVVVASCETFRLALNCGGAAEVVASVFVDAPLRGVKMASRLLAQLIAHRREAGVDALVLFSEVGTGIYEREGFRLLPAPTRRWAAADRPPPTLASVPRNGLPALLADRRRWRDGTVDLLVTEPIFDWHLARSTFYARTLGRPAPETVGAHAGTALALWTADFRHDTLRLLDVSGLPGTPLDPLVDAAAAEARRLGLGTIELWDDAHSARLGPPPLDERDDDVPMGLSFTPRGELFLGPLSRAAWA